MEKVLISDTNLTNIANAIRTVNGTSNTYTPSQMSTAITNIPADIAKPFVIRSDASIIQTYAYDQYIVADEGIKETITDFPTYSTSSITLKASESLTPTVTLDLTTYDYYITERFLTIPIYSITTKGKGREEFSFSSALYEVCDIEPNTMHALIDGKIYTPRSTNIISSALSNRHFYWSGSSSVNLYNTTAYGTFLNVAAPTISSDVLTIKSPSFMIRGHTSYLTSTYYNAITDIRFQYIINVYRAPKNNLNEDGWGNTQQIAKIIDCVNSSNSKLT